MIKLPKDIEYIITDFDGIMTDNYIYIPNNSDNYTMRLNFRDIMAVSLAQKNGYKVGIISGEASNAVEYVKNKFHLEEVHTNIRKKIDVMHQIIEKYNLNPEKIVYIGDDVNDIETLNFVGYPITVQNGIDAIKAIPNIQITNRNGGEGAFREIIDALIS
ncbi:MAG: HAD-IIIA family hydrolase [Candidatus Gastranaerophilales bacterium]|nr:HAD-IIIA family hydrolase [Candidatus Gastranaerophilales bacterium]